MKFRDFEEFLEQCDAHKVRYLIVGGHAVGFHAEPRATKDLDVFIDGTPENAERMLSAIQAFFGGASIDHTAKDFLDPDIIIQLGVAPVRIDILSALKGLDSFEGAWQRRVQADFGDVKAFYISLDDLMASKKAAGRHRDLADLEVLEGVKSLRDES